MVGDILQPTHLLFVLIVALLVLGPKRLPEVGRSLGRGLRDFKNAISGEESNESPLPPTTSQTPAQPAHPAQPFPPAQPVEPAPPVETPQPADVTHPGEPAATGAPAPTGQPPGSVDPAAPVASDADPQPVATSPTNPAS